MLLFRYTSKVLLQKIIEEILIKYELLLHSESISFKKIISLEENVISFNRGSFTNYVDQFLTYFDHLPTYRGLSWTFGAPPTPCPRGHRKIWPPMYNMYLVLQLLLRTICTYLLFFIDKSLWTYLVAKFENNKFFIYFFFNNHFAPGCFS